MNYKDKTYISTEDLLYKGILRDIRKSKTALQPIFEAFTNAIEAIRIKERKDNKFKGRISIIINASKTTLEHNEFNNIEIIDNGIGFNDEEFKRFNTYKDFTKGFKNLGSGRIQFAHFFDTTVINSVFKKSNEYFEREFIVSKKEFYLKRNAIVYHKYCKQTDKKETGTSVKFNNILENIHKYNELDESSLKEAILERYIHYFCYNKASLPKIEIKFYLQKKLEGLSEITKQDIPDIDQHENFKLPYLKLSSDNKSIEKTDDKEEFKIDAFKIPNNILKENRLKLVSKGEIVESSDVNLQNLAEKDSVNGSQFLFLVSSDYIDTKDTNLRGELEIPTREHLNKSFNLFNSRVIFVEDIQNEVNATIDTMYPEIEGNKQKHIEKLDNLKEMFLLDDETFNDINVSINDSESKILEKFYEAEAKKTAGLDYKIKESFDKLNTLDTTSDTYNEDLKTEIEKLVKVIPQQNKTDLTQYIARRKLVLDLMDKILGKQLEIQKNSSNKFDEALLHNLLFQQGADNPEKSDLWIINEDFIYFKGSSEKQLSKLSIDGEKIFKENFTVEEDKYLNSLNENRKIKRPDVLLFPEEGKCIILEFKAPEVNVAQHLNQINIYASLIRNYTIDKFQIKTFYGYLIGESIEPKDVLGYVSSYEISYHFDYLFKPSEKVVGFNDRDNGTIYTEVIKYSTLLERAKRRNKIFIDKIK